MFIIRLFTNVVSFTAGLWAAIGGVHMLAQEVLREGHAATNPVVVGLILMIGGAILFTAALRDLHDQART